MYPYDTLFGGAASLVKAMGERAFWNEDKPMLVAQQERIGTVDIMELKPVIDAGAVRARRKLEMLARRAD